MLGLSDFDIYRNGSDTLHSVYVYKYALPFEKVEDKIGWTLFFQKHWYHSISISIAYYIIIRLIERLMHNRKPFDLRRELFVWNAGLAIFSWLGLVRFSEDFLYNWYIHGFQYSICHSCNPDSVAAFWSLLFAISKIVELGDTLFIVLRKKPLIFLHYYHHVAVLVYTIHSGAEHTAPGQAFISMNYLAHSFMYTYYACTAYGKRLPPFVSILVTTVQTAQMFGGVAVSLFVYKLKVYDNYKCQQSIANLYLAFIIYVTFAALFLQFFHGAYIKQEKKKKID